MSIAPTFAFALDYVSDIEASKRFYEEVLGLKAQRYDPTFVQFDRFAIASDASIGGANEPEIYWTVDDAEAALQELSAKTEISIPLRDLPFGKVFAVKDPSGRQRFLLEFARNRPSKQM